MQSINYSSLEKYLVKKDQSSLKGTLIGVGIFVGFFPFCIILFLLLSLFPFLWVGVAILLIVLVRKGRKYSRRSSSAFSRFIIDNGWRAGGVSPEVPLTQKIHYKSSPAMMSGQIDDLPFWYYKASPSKGAAQNSLPLAVLTVELPKEVPTILLAPNMGIFASMMDRIAEEDYGLKRITLEGDFSDTVRMYIPEGSGIDALSYMTPEVMIVIRDKVDAYVMYSGKYISTSARYDGQHSRLQQLLEDMQLIAKEVKEKQNI